MNASPPIWRSMLFLPVLVERFIERAHTRGADAYILDLEDSVPAARKEAARACVANRVDVLLQHGSKILVRVNNEPSLLARDIEAACIPGVGALVLPKIDNAMDVSMISAQIEAAEIRRGIDPGRIGLIAQIENVRALPRLDEIAQSSSRLLGMILGSEDFSVSAGMEPIPETLFGPNQQVAFACRRVGILPYGFPASIANYDDLDGLRGQVRLARRMGFVGAFCVHPAQVAVLNEGFTPSLQEVEDAQGILAAFGATQEAGLGAAGYRGRMIDAPIIARARETIAAAKAANMINSQTAPRPKHIG